MTEANIANREIISTRLLSAPRELVFEAWTKPEHLIKWWGPNGFTHTFKEIEVKPGGVWRFIMHGPDGTDYPNRVVFEEIEPPSRIVYLHDSDGDEPSINFKVEINFEERENKTLLTMRMEFPTAEALALVVNEYGALEGQKQHLNKLEAHLEKMMEGKL